jgi:hypothetical protein
MIEQTSLSAEEIAELEAAIPHILAELAGRHP